MTDSALLIGAIGVLTETSDLQRRSFNTAFEVHELDWHWDTETYRRFLQVPGGKARLRHWAEARDVDVDFDAIYETKVEAFRIGAMTGLTLRPGVGDIIAEARAQGIKVGFATSTDPRQVALILEGLEGQLDPSCFDYIGDGTKVARSKPAPDIYNDALRALDVAPHNALAIEDTPESAAAAVAAGIETLAYPGAMAMDRDFGADVTVIERPDVKLLRQTEAA